MLAYLSHTLWFHSIHNLKLLGISTEQQVQKVSGLIKTFSRRRSSSVLLWFQSLFWLGQTKVQQTLLCGRKVQMQTNLLCLPFGKYYWIQPWQSVVYGVIAFKNFHYMDAHIYRKRMSLCSFTESCTVDFSIRI